MTKVEFYITIGLVVMLVVGLIGNKVTQHKIAEDPERQKKLEEKAKAWREQQEEEKELDDIASSIYDDYTDTEDYSDD